MTKKTTTIVAVLGFISFALFFVFLGLSQEYNGWVIPTIAAAGGFIGAGVAIAIGGETKKK